MHIRKLLILSVTVCLLQGCTDKGASNRIVQTVSETYIEETSGETTPEIVKEEIKDVGTTDYHIYIPVYVNGVIENLYDLLETDCILYFTKKSCDDCAEFKDGILTHLEKNSLPYHMITVSEHAEDVGSYSIDSKVAKGLGLNKVPVLCFMKDGAFLPNTLEDFENDGELIDIYIKSLYEQNEGSRE